jgi:hypothetical protein
MSNFKIIDDKLEIKVEFTYFNKTEYISTYREIIYIIDDAISIIDGKVFLNNATKFRQKVTKLLDTYKYNYNQSNLRLGIRKGMFSQYSLDYERELTDISLNFPDDSVRKKWLRIQKISKILDV